MTKRKLQRFEELKTFERVYEYPPSRLHELPPVKGTWNSAIFKRDSPIVAELGCGRGEYTIALSKSHQEKNYIGIDIKGARLWRGAKTSHDEKLLHVAFIRTTIEFMDHFFNEGELSEIWITFPDPQPALQREKRRLTHPDKLQLYKKLLKPGGLLHLKTDNADFYEYSHSVLSSFPGQLLYQTSDLYNNPPQGFNLDIQTTYEMKFLSRGHSIHYLLFRF